MTITTLTIKLPNGKTKKRIVKILNQYSTPYNDFYRVQDLDTEEIFRSHVSQLAHVGEKN